MPDNPEPPASLAQAETAVVQKNPFAHGKKGKLSGLDEQQGIRAFFASNAVLSILILVMICLFLAKEAYSFLPEYNKELKNYRSTGLEYVGTLEGQYKKQKELYALVDTAYSIERQSIGAEEIEEILCFNNLVGNAQDEAIDTFDEWEEALEAHEEAEDELDSLDSDATPAETAAATAAVAETKTSLDALRAEWKEIMAEEINSSGKPNDLPADAWPEMRDAALALEPDSGVSPYVTQRQAQLDQATGAIREPRDLLKSSIRPLESVWLEIRDLALENKAKAESYSSAPKRIAALEEGLTNLDSEEEIAKQKLVIEGLKPQLVEPDWDTLVQPMYATREAADAASATLLEAIATARTQLPHWEALTAPKAQDALEEFYRQVDGVESEIVQLRDESQKWNHNRSHSMFSTILGFFFGTRWETNSSFQDFYGLLPLLSGSVLISAVALIIAVPIGVTSAVYVNQLAARREASLIKPTIEFIQAIPSVVLGIFGILILGPSLVELSQNPSLSWIPGFPMEDSLNVLNAGLLLAFMAVPTIFTLAEDAINNVPTSYRDASFALGATKLQTTTRVIVPTAITGILAAILLGLGRVIGETMVVLLVAGNRISIPDFSSGLGVVTQPVHTMTGLIAQETGEVTRDTLHWGALFAVGLVLFTISLIINAISQYLINRRENHG